jgi:hypothetical protein
VILTENGQEWVEATTMGDLAAGRRIFVPGRKIEPEARLALLQERAFMLAERWMDSDPKDMPTPQHYADELKRIIA